jgi:hypothetical protein
MHKINLGDLKTQLDNKKLGKTKTKMTDEEYAMNKKLLESAKMA